MVWGRSAAPGNTKLNRDVALKILPDAFASDPDPWSLGLEDSAIAHATLGIRRDTLEVLALLGSWVAFTGGLWMLFERAETVLSDHGRASISRWLRQLDPETHVATWPEQFAMVFDSVFGQAHLSRRCFNRSCVASIVSALIVMLILAALPPSVVMIDPIPVFLVAGLVGVFVSLIPDYISLLESRLVIRWMSGARSVHQVASLLVLDVTATAAISAAGTLAGAVFITAFPDRLARLNVASLLSFVKGVALFDPTPVSFAAPGQGVGHVWPAGFSPFFYSAFMTSVWVWLYALSGLIVRATHYFSAGLRVLNACLDIDNKPLRSVGLVSMLIVTAGYLVVVLGFLSTM